MINIKSTLKSVVASLTFRQSLTVVTGMSLSAILGAIFFVTVARQLGPTQFGIFSFLTTILVLLSDIFDFGTNGGIIRFVSEALSQNDILSARRALKLSLKIKLYIGVLLLFAGYFLSAFIARTFLGDANYAMLVIMVFFGATPSLLYDFTSFTLQAYQRFSVYIFQSLTSNVFRLILFIFLITIYPNVFGALSALLGALIISVLFGFGFVGMDFFGVTGENSLVPRIYRFNRWIAVAFLCAALSARLDVFLLAKFSTLSQLGIYSIAQKLAFIFPQIVGGLATVLGPKFGRFASLNEAKNFLTKSFVVTSILALGTLIIALLSPLVIIPTLGSAYSDSVLIFQILLAGMACLLLQVGPTSFITYFLSRPALNAVFSVIQLLLVLTLNLTFIPRFGAIGAGVTFVFSQAFIVIATISAIHMLTKHSFVAKKKIYE